MRVCHQNNLGLSISKTLAALNSSVFHMRINQSDTDSPTLTLEVVEKLVVSCLKSVLATEANGSFISQNTIYMHEIIRQVRRREMII
jgi:hypothetical protein